MKYLYSIFQVLISIQSLILCAEPYYNEPGFERMYGTTAGDSESHKYSEDVFKNNLKHAVLGQLNNPPEGFEDVVKSHFYLKRWVLLKVRCRRPLSGSLSSILLLPKIETCVWPHAQGIPFVWIEMF